MNIEELHKQRENNSKNIERVSNMISNLQVQLKLLLDEDTELYYKILQIEDPDKYAELIKATETPKC